MITVPGSPTEGPQEFLGLPLDAIAQFAEVIDGAQHDVSMAMNLYELRHNMRTVAGIPVSLGKFVSYLSEFEDDIDVVAGMNPKAQLTTEVSLVLTGVRQETKKRIGVGPATAETAAAGISSVLGLLVDRPDVTEQQLPLLSQVVMRRIPEHKKEIPSNEVLALAAPGLLSVLYAMSDMAEANKTFTREVRMNPSPRAGLVDSTVGALGARFMGKSTERQYLHILNLHGVAIATAFHNLLPTDGSKLKQAHSALKMLFE
jgi:hypothetical protein